MYLLVMLKWLKMSYSYLVFKGLSIIGQCPLNVNIPPLEIEAIHMVPEIESGDFHKNGHNDFVSILPVYGDPFPK
jgi:hypothetical protein